MNVLILGAIGTGAIVLACGQVEQMAPPPGIERAWNAPASRMEPPSPPPGSHDDALTKLAQPLSLSDAKRVLVEATVFAPWGLGYGGVPMQALALNVVLEQPKARETLEEIYQASEPSGRLLALCGLQTADREGFSALAERMADSQDEVATYAGCLAERRTVAEFVTEIRTTEICSRIPKSKEHIVAMCKRAG